MTATTLEPEAHMETNTPKARIYVACLAAYNNGKLHGTWIDAAQDADVISQQVSEMLANSPEPGAEEWAIHDYEGFMGATVNESDSFEHIAALAKALKEHGAPFALYYDHMGADEFDSLDEAVEKFQDAFQGEHESLADYAEEWYRETGSIPEDMPEILKNHIDWDGIGRELEIGGDIFTIRHEGKTFVFYNH